MRVSVAVLALATALGVAAAQSQKTMPICSAWQGVHYADAKQQYPELKTGIETVQKHGVVPWYSDNLNQTVLDNTIKVISTCAQDTKIPIVVYGIPNKDCEAGYSNAGSNKNFDDYKTFVGKLTTAFPTQNMLYIIEPDAVGLTADGGCGNEKEYPKYLKYVLEELGANPNAELYLDIGFWTLQPTGKPDKLATVVNDIWPASGSVKGIALNTSNYQRTKDMLDLCESFGKLTGKTQMKCIVDTSRNNKGPSAKGEWCNTKNTGIGVPPTMDTGDSRAAYYLWVKPPGESDGTCADQTSGDFMVGPAAGDFFKDAFVMLWKNSYFVDQGAAGSGDGSSLSGSSSNSTTTSPPATTPSSTPKATTSAPSSPATVGPAASDDESDTEATSPATPSAAPTKSPSLVPSATPAPSTKKCNVKRHTRRA